MNDKESKRNKKIILIASIIMFFINIILELTITKATFPTTILLPLVVSIFMYTFLRFTIKGK